MPQSTAGQAPRKRKQPKPEQIETADQACANYGGPNPNACHDSYEFGCVNGQTKDRVHAYYEGNAPRPLDPGSAMGGRLLHAAGQLAGGGGGVPRRAQRRIPAPLGTSSASIPQ